MEDENMSAEDAHTSAMDDAIAALEKSDFDRAASQYLESPESPDTGETETAETKPAENTNPELDRLTEREKAIATREADFDAKIQAARADFEKQMTGMLSATELAKLAETNPSEFYEKIGVDGEHLMDLMIAQKLEAAGKELPAALATKLRDWKYDQKLRDMENKERERERAYEAERYYNQVIEGGRKYVAEGIDSKLTPTLAEVAKASNTEDIHRLIISEIENDAYRRRAAGEKSGDIISYQEAATRLEKIMSMVAKSLKTPVSKNGVGTTNEAAQETRKPIPPVAKPKESVDPVKELEEEGIEAAMKTFYRLEAKNKR